MKIYVFERVTRVEITATSEDEARFLLGVDYETLDFDVVNVKDA